MTPPILIIGAGLSGLTVSRILTNASIPNIVFEASTPDRTQGYAISLREWGYTSLLTALGDLPLRSLTRGVAPDRILGGTGWIDQALRDNHTGNLLVAPDPEAKQCIVRANRNALRTWIADSGDEEVDIRYGHRLRSVQGSMGNVTATFENGAKYQGSLVIAADGVHSTVRSQILPHVSPDIVPVVVYHGELELPRKEFDNLIRPHSGPSNILAGVGDGFNTPITVCNITPTHVHLDWSYSRPSIADKDTEDPLYRPHVSAVEAKQIPPALLEEIASRDLARPWSQLLNAEALPTHRVFNWVSRCVSVTREDVNAAQKQGVVFIGDSWHAMPIFGGEGGNHALVDAVELAEALMGKEGELDAAVTGYYDRAWRRCQEAVRRSRQRFFQLHRPMREWMEIAEKKKMMAAMKEVEAH